MKILKDNLLHNLLELNGYVVLNLLNLDDVRMYMDKYEAIKPKLPFVNGIHITMEHAVADTSRHVAEQLIKLSYDKFADFFQDYKLFQGSFLVKEHSHNTNTVPLHQDWTFVDENNGYDSYTVWIALTDSTKEMGTVGVIEGSHKHLNQIRYTPNEQYTGYQAITPYAENKTIKYIELKAGQALVWNHKLVHNSLPNISDKERINMTFCITKQDAQLKLFWLSPHNSNLIEFDVSDDFYYYHNSKIFYDWFQKGDYPKDASLLKEK